MDGAQIGGVERAVAGALLVGGLLVGLGLGGGRTARARIRLLEAELGDARERLARYQDQVTKHFTQTSELFVELTRQHRVLWSQLAEGARELCSQSMTDLAPGFADTPLLGPEGGTTSEPEAEPAGWKTPEQGALDAVPDHAQVEPTSSDSPDPLP